MVGKQVYMFTWLDTKMNVIKEGIKWWIYLMIAVPIALVIIVVAWYKKIDLDTI